MKRTLSLLFAAMLILCAVSAACADVPFATKYFTLTLPDNWEAVTDEPDSDSKDDIEELGYFYPADEETGLIIEALLTYYEELKDFSMWGAEESELQEYTEFVLDDFADSKPELLGVVKAGSIPFVLIRAEDEDGEFLYAETVTNGYAISFVAYVADENRVYPMTDSAVEQFKSVLATFLPVT